MQSIHGCVWCGCDCVPCVHLCDTDVLLSPVFLYVSVPGWVLGPLDALLSSGSISFSLGFQRKKRTVHMEGKERNIKAMTLDTGILSSSQGCGLFHLKAPQALTPTPTHPPQL